MLIEGSCSGLCFLRNSETATMTRGRKVQQLPLRSGWGRGQGREPGWGRVWGQVWLPLQWGVGTEVTQLKQTMICLLPYGAGSVPKPLLMGQDQTMTCLLPCGAGSESKLLLPLLGRRYPPQRWQCFLSSQQRLRQGKNQPYRHRLLLPAPPPPFWAAMACPHGQNLL